MMTERDFIYWFNGFLEMSKTETLNKEQLDMVKKHIELVIKRVVDVPNSTAPHYDFFSTPAKIC